MGILVYTNIPISMRRISSNTSLSFTYKSRNSTKINVNVPETAKLSAEKRAVSFLLKSMHVSKVIKNIRKVNYCLAFARPHDGDQNYDF